MQRRLQWRSMDSKRKIIDVHAHILPGVDDGARTMEESVELIKMAVSQGVIGIIATPHYSRHHSVSTLKEVLAELQEKAGQEYPGFQIYLGQETIYHEELSARLRNGQALVMAGSRYVLVEFSTGISYRGIYQGIRTLTGAGYWPILAHMERYGCLREAETRELYSLGCRMQMNYESLQGNWLNRDVRWCRKQVLEGKIQFLGSDMHRVDHRAPNIAGAQKWLDGHVKPETVRKLVYENPLHIIHNEKI